MDPKRSTQIQVFMVVWGRTQCRKCSGLICVSSAPHGNASYLLFSRKIFLTYTFFSETRFLFFIWIRSDHCLALPVSNSVSLLLTDNVETWLMWRWQILNWIVAFFNAVTWICQICYMDLSKLLQNFSHFSLSVLWIPCSPKCIPHFPSLVIVLFPRQKNGAKIMHVMHRLLVFVHSLLYLFASLLELFPWEKRKDLLLPLLMEDL